MHRVFSYSFARIYQLYTEKIDKKGRTQAELDEVLRWLTGFTDEQLRQHIADEITLGEFVEAARFNPDASLITGVICGVRVEDIEDAAMQKVRYLDKVVDELAKGKAVEKVLRGERGTPPRS